MLTHYGSIICGAPVCIAVFLDVDLSYDCTEDVQAIGYCMQYMLLQIHALGMGAVWLGEILKNRVAVQELLAVPPKKEFMALIAPGYPDEKDLISERKRPEEVVFYEV